MDRHEDENNKTMTVYGGDKIFTHDFAYLSQSEKNGTPVYGYSSKSIKISKVLIKYRREIIEQYLDFEVKYSNEDFDRMIDLACWLTELERIGELNLTTTST